MAAKNSKNNVSGSKSRRRRRGSTKADWTAVDPRAVARLIVIVAGFDGAVRFGNTSDGGAYAIGIYGDGDKPYTEYISGSLDITDELDRLCDEFEAGDGGL